jgi:hypothetical protein
MLRDPNTLSFLRIEDSTGAVKLPRRLGSSQTTTAGVTLDLPRAAKLYLDSGSILHRLFTALQPVDVNFNRSIISVFDQTPSNPTEAAVRAAVEVYKANRCDGLIAVGGGSAIDCAKGVAIAATHDGPLTHYATIEGGSPRITTLPDPAAHQLLVRIHNAECYADYAAEKLLTLGPVDVTGIPFLTAAVLEKGIVNASGRLGPGVTLRLTFDASAWDRLTYHVEGREPSADPPAPGDEFAGSTDIVFSDCEPATDISAIVDRMELDGPH